MTLNAASAARLPPRQTAISNNPSQYLDIAMLPSRDDELPCHDRRGDYNGDAGKSPARPGGAATFHRRRYQPTSLPPRHARVADLRYRSAMIATPSGLQYEDTVVGTG